MTEQYRILFEPTGLSETVEAGTTVLEAAASANAPIRSDCGGKGLCGKCKVIIEQEGGISGPTETENRFFPAREIAASWRLACQAEVSGPVTVRIPETSAESFEGRGKAGLEGSFPVKPLVTRLFVRREASPASRENRSRNLPEWLASRAGDILGREIGSIDDELLRGLGGPEALSGGITLVHHAEKGVTAALPGRKQNRSLGVAIDLGTTTVAVYLCDFRTGRILAASATANPQRRFGEDVISRIAMANERASGLETLRRLVVDAANRLIGGCLKKAGATRDDVDEITVVGNTTMEQIFAGIHPRNLGVSPYLPAFHIAPEFSAKDVGLDIHPGTRVHLFPVVSGFVGGDAMGVVLASEPYRSEEVQLLVDIGTNGEVILGNQEGLWATSCATGPALEGAHISCGVRAVSGAISAVEIESSSGRVDYRVIGQGKNLPPIGICGSGIIDAVAAMRRAGWIFEDGRFNREIPAVITDKSGVGRKAVLVPEGESATGKEIALTLKDVRQVQLAKAALCAGIEMLMKKAGIRKIDRVWLTGAFGARFDWRSAAAVGMIPSKAFSGEVRVAENLAGVGAILALLDGDRRTEAAELSRRIRFLELAAEPEFAEAFVNATRFPPTEGQGVSKGG